MRLRYTVPLRAYLLGNSPAALEAAARFELRGFTVRVVLKGTEPFSFTRDDGSVVHYCHCTGVDVEIAEIDPDGRRLQPLIDVGARTELLELLADAANRVLLSIRNFGRVAHVATLKQTRPRRIFFCVNGPSP